MGGSDEDREFKLDKEDMEDSGVIIDVLLVGEICLFAVLVVPDVGGEGNWAPALLYGIILSSSISMLQSSVGTFGEYFPCCFLTTLVPPKNDEVIFEEERNGDELEAMLGDDGGGMLFGTVPCLDCACGSACIWACAFLCEAAWFR